MKKEKMVRTQVTITNGELEVLKEWVLLPNDMYENAIINGVVNQIIKNKS